MGVKRAWERELNYRKSARMRVARDFSGRGGRGFIGGLFGDAVRRKCVCAACVHSVYSSFITGRKSLGSRLIFYVL